MPFAIRPALLSDIAAMHAIRLAVRENRLGDPDGLTEASYPAFLTEHGRGWVAEDGERIVGFAILDIAEQSVWALFVSRDAEGAGVGRALHDQLVDWSAAHGLASLWLTTGPGTRAECFYAKAGWQRIGTTTEGEVRFERRLK